MLTNAFGVKPSLVGAGLSLAAAGEAGSQTAIVSAPPAFRTSRRLA
jgi:hypothetical protein